MVASPGKLLPLVSACVSVMWALLCHTQVRAPPLSIHHVCLHMSCVGTSRTSHVPTALLASNTDRLYVASGDVHITLSQENKSWCPK